MPEDLGSNRFSTLSLRLAIEDVRTVGGELAQITTAVAEAGKAIDDTQDRIDSKRHRLTMLQRHNSLQQGLLAKLQCQSLREGLNKLHEGPGVKDENTGRPATMSRSSFMIPRVSTDKYRMTDAVSAEKRKRWAIIWEEDAPYPADKRVRFNNDGGDDDD